MSSANLVGKGRLETFIIFQIKVNLDGSISYAINETKMKKLDSSEIKEKSYILGMRPRMESTDEKNYIHLIYANWIDLGEVFYLRISPEDDGSTEVHSHVISSQNKSKFWFLGMEAVWVETGNQSTVGGSNSNSYQSYESYWVGYLDHKLKTH